MSVGDEFYRSLLKAASFSPRSQESPLAWMGHIPFAAWLIPHVRPRTLVELGTHSGNSYFAMCQAVAECGLDTQCYAVDTWRGDEHAGQYDDTVYQAVSKHNTECYAAFSTLMRMTFDEASERFAEGSVELLHIDGMHTYEAVSHDFETWKPKLAPGAIVLFHDTQVRERDFGVWKFWQEITQLYPRHMEFIHSNGLGVVQMPGRHAAHLPGLDSSEAGSQMVEYFAQLGTAICMRHELKQLNNNLSEHRRHLEALVAENGKRDSDIAQLNGQLSVVRRERDRLRDEYLSITNSTVWRLTAPVRGSVIAIRALTGYVRHLGRVYSSRGGVSGLLKTVSALYSEHGIAGLRYGVNRIRAIISETPEQRARNDYSSWIRDYDTLTEDKIQALRAVDDQMTERPVISLIVPVFNPNIGWLEEAIQSVQDQLYPNWELCIADDHSTDPQVRPFLERKIQMDRRIQVVFRDFNGHISAASNSALGIASGDWVALLDQDDLLTKDALLRVVQAINRNPEARLIYSDEDKIDQKGNRFGPYFKPDWNRYLFYSQNLITHLGVYKHSIVERIGGFRKRSDGAQDYDLALRFIEQVESRQIVHIPRILYHWRAHLTSTASHIDAKSYAVEAGQTAIQQHFDRLGIDAEVTPHRSGFRVQYALPSPPPKVSLVILTRDGLDYLRRCVDSILQKTEYSNWDLIIVDNGTADPECLSYLRGLERDHEFIEVIEDQREFYFSALNNLAVDHCDSELVALLNNDVEVIDRDWLCELVALACQPDIGAVGPKLLYPNNTVQHAGIVLGLGGAAGHVHQFMKADQPGYAGRLSLINEYSALTGACLVVRRALYKQVGGLDADNFAVAFNDVDFCLKLRELGYRNVYTPHAALYHHESVSRGYEDTPEKQARFEMEKQRLKIKWAGYMAHDPAYNPNLTADFSDFSLAWPPRHTETGPSQDEQ